MFTIILLGKCSMFKYFTDWVYFSCDNGSSCSSIEVELVFASEFKLLFDALVKGFLFFKMPFC